MTSDDNCADTFKVAMAALVEHCIAIKELPKASAKPYRCNVLSVTRKEVEEGENISAGISVTKVTSDGKADNLNASKRLLESVNDDANLLPEKTRLAIREAMRQGELFIRGHREMKALYCDQEDLEKEAA